MRTAASPRRAPGARTPASRVARAALKAIGSALVVAALGAAGWLAYTSSAKTDREVLSPLLMPSQSGRWLAAPGARIHAREWGDPRAPALLLVHGTGAWSGTWFGLPDALAAAGWHVVGIDLPPFGLSTTDSTPGDYTRATQARRVLAAARSLQGPVALMGHSFGAGPALEAAMISSAERGPIAQLILVDAALGLGPHGEAPECAAPPASALLARRGLREALVAATATWPGLTSTMLKSFVHRKQVVDESLLPAYRVPFSRTGYSGQLGDWAWAFAASACEDALSLSPRQVQAWAAAFPGPVDIIWGARDEITPVDQALALSRWMPKAGLRMLDDVGHIPHIEDPAAFAAAILAALGMPGTGPASR